MLNELLYIIQLYNVFMLIFRYSFVFYCCNKSPRYIYKIEMPKI